MSMTYSVPEISCEHCRSSIEAAVNEVADVQRVDVDIESKTVTVDGGAQSAVISAIEEAGYDVAR